MLLKYEFYRKVTRQRNVYGNNFSSSKYMNTTRTKSYLILAQLKKASVIQ